MKKRQGGHRFLWVTLLAALLLAYNGIGFILVPYLIKTGLPKYLEERVGVIFAADTARFNPYTFALEIAGLTLETMQDGQAAERFVAAHEFKVDLDLLSLLRGDLVSSTMDIDRLNINITRDENRQYNIAYLFRGEAALDQSEIIDFAELPFLFSFNNINITDSQLIFDDRSSGKIHHVENIELALPAISNFPYQSDSYIHPRFSAVVNGSPVTLTGEAALGGAEQDGRQTLLSCNLDDIDIPLYFEYLPAGLPVDIVKGKANGKLQISFSPEQEQGSKLKIQFLLSTTDLGLESRNSKLSLTVPAAKLEGSLEPFNHSLVFQNILLREPVLTSDGVISRETLDNLAPLTLRPGSEHPLHQAIPSFAVKLLIADGGSVIIKKPKEKKPVRIWHSIQLSLKNFTNDRVVPAEEESSFRLSGEHLSSAAFFTWQGGFDNRNHPGGNLQLNNIPASLIAPFLGRKTEDITGTADVKGLLNLGFTEQGEAPFDYTLKSTSVAIRDLRIQENGVEWLHTPSLRCEPVSRIQGTTDLGNVFLENSTVILEREKLPHLFERFSGRQSQHILHGIDFSGNVQVLGEKSGTPLLALSKVVFQANKLEQQQLQPDNFVFSAQVGTTGEIKAKGGLNIVPVQLHTDIAVTNLKPEELFIWFSGSQTLLNSKADLSAKGTFRYPEQEFEGQLSAEDVVIGASRNPVLRAGRTQLAEFSWSKSAQRLAVKRLIVDEPEFSWRRTVQEQHPATLAAVFLRHLFLPEPEAGAADPDASLSRFTLNIDSLEITDGSLSYQDDRLTPPLALGITAVNGSLDKLHYPIAKDKSTISLAGNIEGTPFNLKGTGLLLQTPASARITFTAPALPLPLFSRQITGQFSDIDISSATAAVSATATFQNNAAEKRAEIIATGMKPVRPGTATATTLALLTGNNGTITLVVEPDESRVNDPVFSVALRDFGKLKIKGSINPMLVAGDGFKDLVEAQYISFLPGTATMTGESIERLGRYSEFLAVHPLIDLLITGYADESTDTPVLLAELVRVEEQRVAAENRQRAQAWQEQKKAEQRETEPSEPIRETDIPVTAADTFIPLAPRTVEVTGTMLADLAREREQVVINHFVERLSVSADRVKPGDIREQRLKRDGTHARAVIGLSDRYPSETNKKS